MPVPEITRKQERDLDDEMMGSEMDDLPDPYDLEGEEIDPDEDGDDGDDEVRLMNVAPMAEMMPPDPPPSRSKPSVARTRRRSATTGMNKRLDENLGGILDGLEFGTDAHKINVARIEPAYDPETGVRIAGLLESFRRPIEVEDIQKRFGGGIYAVTVHGPGGKGRRAGIVARRQVEIAGPPKPQPNPREEARKKQLEESKNDGLIESLMEREERRSEQQRQEQTALRRELAQMQTKMFETLAKANENKTDPTAALAPMLQAMSENNARQEQLRREEMQRQEAARKEDLARQELARKEERDEQRRRDEDRQRQWEAEQKRQEQQFQLQLESIKADQARATAEATQRAEAERNNMQFMLSFMTKTDAEKEARSRETSTMQMEFMRQMSEQGNRFSQAQMEMLKAQFDSKDDFFGSIEKFAMIRDLFNPKEEDDRPGWERAVDKIGEVAQPFVPGLLSMATGQAQQAPGTPAPLPPGGGPRRVAPGTVVVVEDLESDLPQQQMQPPPQEPEVLDPESAQTQEQEVQAAAEPQENQLTEFPEEYPADLQQSLTLVVMALDLAMQQELSVDEMYEKTVAKLPAAHKMLIKGFGADTLVDYIESKAGIPDTWAIQSLEAEDKIRALYDKLVSEA